MAARNGDSISAAGAVIVPLLESRSDGRINTSLYEPEKMAAMAVAVVTLLN
jgi:hypothetical protein